MEEKKQCKGMIYQVKNGDTLYRIAKMHGIKVRDLMLANPYVNVYQLQIGDELCVPVFTNMPGNGVRPYRVGKNETLGSILKKTGLSYEELVKMNKKIEDLPVSEGTVLLIPQKNQKENIENTLESQEDLT
ncbi:MAG: LysM peptidoglycan-binding domain-containing protein [Lachnospiraceae bacterium]|nr:LysM peptidoglycan-binding domain-containing protein [Lachnospiraceae bacterium]